MFTHQPPDDETRPELDFLSGDIAVPIATGLRAAGGKNLLVLGANVAQPCLEADLVDEILLKLLPIVLGDSIRLSVHPDTARRCSKPSRSIRPDKRGSRNAADTDSSGLLIGPKPRPCRALKEPCRVATVPPFRTRIPRVPRPAPSR